MNGRLRRTRAEAKRQLEFAKVKRRPRSNEIKVTEFIRLVYRASSRLDQDPGMRTTETIFLRFTPFFSPPSPLLLIHFSDRTRSKLCAPRRTPMASLVYANGIYASTAHGARVTRLYKSDVRRRCVSGFGGGEARQDEARRAPSASHVCGFINWVRRWGFFY